ncbi:DDT domain-containing protein DDR4 isoform X1 [Arachis ipaensis]|uniref:DDT domain-containing protein DDR4 isoform X1 n=1 Tax=Arachis ipaensis TaxID=130454 RepID=UPI0007AFAB76|nr:DDT domain-containing protein DDR4 isoform X1 [Arachis ipaensis]
MSQGSPLPANEPSNPHSPEPDSQKDTETTTTGTTTAADEPPPPALAPVINRSNRPSRACTIRAAARIQAASQPAIERRKKAAKKEQSRREELPSPSSPPQSQQQQCSKIVTPLVEPPTSSQLPRFHLRSMWELASALNFLNLFRPLLNIQVEFSAEEFETALLTPNDTLAYIHMPLLKAIPPITRMALTRDTWITVLCRKLRDWWHWVADGDLPIVASHGAEVEAYRSLDPGVRVVILKALCDIRVEQEDIRNYIDNSLKHGVQLSTFRKERIGGDSHGISYWYEDDPIIGHRLYREIRKTEVVQERKGKPRGSRVLSNTSYQWEAIATNFDEFQDVSEKLFSSKNRTEASVGKKLKIDMLAEIEKVHKKKERLMKKQHREALLLDNFLGVDGLATGRSLRDRKPVTYTFDDYDRSINEAIKITKKKQPSPEPIPRREAGVKPDALTNGKLSGPSYASQHQFSMASPKSPDFDDEEEHERDMLDRSNRQRQRPRRYSENEFIEVVSDNDVDFDSDDDIVGEAVYDEEYLRKRKQRRKFSSSSASEGDEEYHWDEDNVEEEEEEDSMSISEDSDKPQPRKVKQLPGRTRRETKLRSMGEIHSGLRRSKRATRNRINYRQYEMSESDTEFIKPDKSNASDKCSDHSENGEFMVESEESDGNDDDREFKVDEPATNPAAAENEYPAAGENEDPGAAENEDHAAGENEYPVAAKTEEPATGENEEPAGENPRNQYQDQNQHPENSSSPPGQEEVEGMSKRRFLDLNELAPSSGFDDGPTSHTSKHEGNGD